MPDKFSLLIVLDMYDSRSLYCIAKPCNVVLALNSHILSSYPNLYSDLFLFIVCIQLPDRVH